MVKNHFWNYKGTFVKCEKSSLKVNGRGKKAEEAVSSLKVVMTTATADFV